MLNFWEKKENSCKGSMFDWNFHDSKRQDTFGIIFFVEKHVIEFGNGGQ